MVNTVVKTIKSLVKVSQLVSCEVKKR